MNVQRYLLESDASIVSRVTEDLLRTRRHLHVAEQLVKLLAECVLVQHAHEALRPVAFNTRVAYLGSAANKLGSFDLPHPENEDAAERLLLTPLALALLGAPTTSTVACVSALGVEQLRILCVSPLPRAEGSCADRRSGRCRLPNGIVEAEREEP